MSSFDKARYGRLLEGPEATEMMPSEVRSENDKLRIDSGHFAKPMLLAEQPIRSYADGFDELGAVFSRFVKGIFDINADAHVARQRATRLLDAARRAVEVAIEKSDDAALAILESVVPTEK